MKLSEICKSKWKNLTKKQKIMLVSMLIILLVIISNVSEHKQQKNELQIFTNVENNNLYEYRIWPASRKADEFLRRQYKLGKSDAEIAKMCKDIGLPYSQSDIKNFRDKGWLQGEVHYSKEQIKAIKEYNKKIEKIVKENQTNKKSPEDLLWFAKYQCEKEIKARAIYPPAVKVKFRDDHYVEGNSYTVYGTVDSQNAFGAMVRQNFGCEIIIDQQNDKFQIKDLLIE